VRPKVSVLEEYERLAPVYDRKWAFYIEATTRETLSRLNLKPRTRILDVGCGTGALLSELARREPSAELVGIDPAPQMLAIARGRVPPAVSLLEGWAEKLPCQDESFDLVVSCNMLHYVREPAAALREMARVLRPGGHLAITDWCDDYLACRACNWYLRLFRRVQTRIYGGKACLRMVRDCGHFEARVERYKINWLWGLMTASATKEPRSATSPS
jgi:ubiquinone/menaquinone biosynthesis C-methylase UbiE